MRRPLVLVTALCCSAFSVLCTASSAAKAHRSHVHYTRSSVDFTASTHLGPCDQSWILVDVLADHVREIDLFECTGTIAPVKTLYAAEAK